MQTIDNMSQAKRVLCSAFPNNRLVFVRKDSKGRVCITLGSKILPPLALDGQLTDTALIEYVNANH